MLDGVFLLCVKQELDRLIGTRIDKIYQPSRDEIVLSFRGAGVHESVLIATGGTSGRIHITKVKAENPAQPPMFCMLMRKLFSGGKLLSVRQEGLERILFLDFDTINELGDREVLTMTVEIMGKYSNLILLHENGKIIDALHRLDDITAVRLILPGVTYTAPGRQERLNFIIAPETDMQEKLREISGAGRQLRKELIGIFEGISPVLASEWCFRAFGGDITAAELDNDKISALTAEILRTRDNFLSGKRVYNSLWAEQAKDFCFEDITQYSGIYTKKIFDTPSALLDDFYSEGAAAVRLKQRYSELYKLIGGLYTKTLRRLENRRLELAQSDGRDKYRLWGDLLSANLYRIKRGDRELVCENYLEEGCPTISIPLDEMLTPSQNMQGYYKRYRREDNAQKRLTELIAEDEKELAYLETVKGFADMAAGEAEIDAIRSELSDGGYIRSAKGRKMRDKKLPPLEYTSPDGFTILVGRSNRQNDELTCKTAQKTDIWLHTKDITGSHVIIRSDGQEIPDSTILYAARLAARHSSGRSSSQVPVDYTFVKYVKKPGGAKPGMVIFTNNRTLYVEPMQ